MAYTRCNYRHKKDLLAAMRRGETVLVYQPGPFGPDVPDGRVTLEGPHYPAPHTWYARGVVKNGRLMRLVVR